MLTKFIIKSIFPDSSMQPASVIIERLSGLDCPLVTSLHTSSSTAGGGGVKQITADDDLMASLLLESGDLRGRLLDWCLHRDGQVSTLVFQFAHFVFYSSEKS